MHKLNIGGFGTVCIYCAPENKANFQKTRFAFRIRDEIHESVNVCRV